MSMKLHGVVVSAALNCFSGFFFAIGLYSMFFSIRRSKANVNGLFDYISGHFISILHKYF